MRVANETDRALVEDKMIDLVFSMLHQPHELPNRMVDDDEHAEDYDDDDDNVEFDEKESMGNCVNECDFEDDDEIYSVHRDQLSTNFCPRVSVDFSVDERPHSP